MFDRGNGKYSYVDHLASICKFNEDLVRVPYFPYEGDSVKVPGDLRGEVREINVNLKTCVVDICGVETNFEWDDITLDE